MRKIKATIGSTFVAIALCASTLMTDAAFANTVQRNAINDFSNNAISFQTKFLKHFLSLLAFHEDYNLLFFFLYFVKELDCSLQSCTGINDFICFVIE